MRKEELKDRLRRRAADKLHDFERSKGRVPVQLPAVGGSEISAAPALSTPAGALAAPQPVGLEQRIRERAYFLYLQRGRVDGHALDDWLQAEAELLTPAPPAGI